MQKQPPALPKHTRSSVEIDGDYFPNFGPEVALEPGQMIVWSHALSALKEHVAYLEDRAKYYGERPKSGADYAEVLADLKSRIDQVIKTNQGAA